MLMLLTNVFLGLQVSKERETYVKEWRKRKRMVMIHKNIYLQV